MALFAIGDLHLSLGADKPMDIFGDRWKGYTGKLQKGFELLKPDDVCVICGDISWSMGLENTVADFRFIHALNGKKIILKGNHDYWWSTASKAIKLFEREKIDSIGILHNNFIPYGDDIALCGTRGWFYEEEKGSGHDKKMLQRELLRLEASLKAAGEREKLVFLHYPPRFGSYVCTEICEMLTAYGVKQCCYGHIHGKAEHSAVEGMVEGVTYRLVSADHVNFTPQIILP